MAQQDEIEAGMRVPGGFAVWLRGTGQFMKTVAQYIVWGLGVSTAVLLMYMLFDHSRDSRAQAASIIQTMKDNSSDTVAALKEVAAAGRMQAASMRFQTCILAMAPQEKKQELLDDNSLCHQMERMQ